MSIEADILAQMARSVEVDEALDRLAHQIADEIRDLTPEFGNLPPKRSQPSIGAAGDAKAAIKVEYVASAKKPTRRVISRDFKAIWIEMGSRHMPEYAPFGKVAAMHGGTGPVLDEGIQRAQHQLRNELERLAKMGAEGASVESIAQQRLAVDRARQARSSAFTAARRSRGRRRR